MGRTIRQIQDATDDIKTEIKKSTDDYKKDLNLQGIFKETAEEIKRPLDQAVDDLDQSIKYTPPRKNNLPPKEIEENPTQAPFIPNDQKMDEPVDTGVDNNNEVELKSKKAENSPG